MESGESRREGMFVLRPIGRIDNLTSAAFQDRLMVVVRAGIAGIVIDFSLADGERSRLLIMLEELFTNAVQRGYRGGAAHGRIEIALAAKPGRLEIDFCDDGIPFDPLACEELPEIDRPCPDSRIGGQGLPIVRSLAHRAEYRRDRGRNHLALVRRLAG